MRTSKLCAQRDDVSRRDDTEALVNVANVLLWHPSKMAVCFGFLGADQDDLQCPVRHTVRDTPSRHQVSELPSATRIPRMTGGVFLFWVGGEVSCTNLPQSPSGASRMPLPRAVHLEERLTVRHSVS